jgi:hypothetical protein
MIFAADGIVKVPLRIPSILLRDSERISKLGNCSLHPIV